MNGFIKFGVMFMTATALENSPQAFVVYIVSQSRSVVKSAENPALENSPQLIGELRTWPIYKNFYTRLVRKIGVI